MRPRSVSLDEFLQAVSTFPGARHASIQQAVDTIVQADIRSEYGDFLSGYALPAAAAALEAQHTDGYRVTEEFIAASLLHSLPHSKTHSISYRLAGKIFVEHPFPVKGPKRIASSPGELHSIPREAGVISLASRYQGLRATVERPDPEYVERTEQVFVPYARNLSPIMHAWLKALLTQVPGTVSPDR